MLFFIPFDLLRIALLLFSPLLYNNLNDTRHYAWLTLGKHLRIEGKTWQKIRHEKEENKETSNERKNKREKGNEIVC